MSNLSAKDERELLSRLQKGDRLAFEIIYRGYKGTLYVHAARYLRDQEEARDIIHDVFFNLWQNRGTLYIQESLKAYLYQSVRNRIINHQLKSQRADSYVSSFQHFLINVQADTDYLVRENMMTEWIEQQISSLPNKMRTVFELSRKEGLSHKEIAKQLNITEQSVRSHVKGALKILRLRLGFVLLSFFMLFF